MAPLPLMELTKRSFLSIREKNVIEALHSLDPKTFYCTVDGEIVADFLEHVNDLPEDVLFQIHFRVLGGKGGFGSLLRSFRVNKSTNQLMCRDLNGRRLASIDEEQRLKKWIERMAEREKEKIAKRKAKYEKLKSGPPKHMFDDPDYMRQKETIIEKTEEAFEEGFLEALKAEREKKEKPVESSSSDSDFDIDDLPGGLKTKRKRKAITAEQVEQKKMKMEDEDDDSSSDSEENDVNPELLREIQEYFAAQHGESSKSTENGKFTTSEAESSGVSDEGKIKEIPAESGNLPCVSNSSKLSEKPPTSGEEISANYDIDKNMSENQSTKTEVTEVLQEEEKCSEPTEYPAVDLSLYDSALQLEDLGLNHLKHALKARGMKCGGTLRERAERLFSAKKADHEKM